MSEAKSMVIRRRRRKCKLELKPDPLLSVAKNRGQHSDCSDMDGEDIPGINMKLNSSK